MGSGLADGVNTYVAQEHLSATRRPPSAATVGAGAAERERRIRLEATKRRRWDPDHKCDTPPVPTVHTAAVA